MAEDVPTNSKISYPLYGAALLVTLCGVMTVADSIGDVTFMQEVVALTLAGFAFSLGCRVLHINARLVEWLCLGVIALAAVGALTGRVDWGALLPTEASRNDTRVAVLLCWGAVLLSWALLQDATTLFAPLLAIAEIGLVASSDPNSYVISYFITLLIAMVFLLTHFHALRLRALAPPAEQTRAVPWQVPVQLALAGVCGFGVLALGLALITPVEAVSRNLSIGGAIRRLANIGPVPPSGLTPTRFSDGTSLDIGTGQGWSASSQVLMRVSPSDGRPHLWRGRTYDHYDGTGWQSLLTDQMPLPVSSNENDIGEQTYLIPLTFHSGREVLSAEFDVLGNTDTFYYAAAPRRLMLPAGLDVAPAFGEDGSLSLSGQRPLGHLHYVVWSQAAPNPMDPAVQARLRHAGVEYPQIIRDRYLGNMSDGEFDVLDPQALAYFHWAVAQSLGGLSPRQRTPIAEALAIRNWVSGHCTYSLDVAPLDPQQDHVYQFLDQTRRGYCDMFASSMAVLCRVAGLPARVATGFAPGQQDGGDFVLRAEDKHAWTEVYFPGAGWLDFDPTMGTRTDGTIPNPKTTPHWNWQKALGHLGLLPAVLGGIILVLLLYVAKVEWYDRRFAGRVRVIGVSGAGRSEVWRRYARMTRLLAGLGLPRGVAETPHEYAERARTFLAAQGAGAPDAAMIGTLTAQLTASRYGGEPEPADAQADAHLSAFTVAAFRLWWRLWWRRLTGEGRRATAPTGQSWN